MRLFRQHRHKRQNSPSDWRPLLLGGVALLLVGIWVFLQMLDQPSHSESSPKVVSNATSSPPTTSPVSSDDRTPVETFTFYKTLQAPAHAESEPPGLEPKPSVLPGRTAEPTPGSLDRVQKTRSREYTVQAAAFRERPAAINLIHRLKKKGYPAYLLAVGTRGQETWYRVRLGPYTTRAQAENVARRLKAEERLGSYIARSTEAR